MLSLTPTALNPSATLLSPNTMQPASARAIVKDYFYTAHTALAMYRLSAVLQNCGPKLSYQVPSLSKPRYEKFATAIACGQANSAAYMAAGFKTKNTKAASVEAYRLLRRPEIVERIAEVSDAITATALQASGQSAEMVIRRMVANRNQAFALGQMTAAIRADELIGRDFYCFIERQEVGRAGDFAALSDMELRELVRESAADAGVRKRRAKPAMIEGKAQLAGTISADDAQATAPKAEPVTSATPAAATMPDAAG